MSLGCYNAVVQMVMLGMLSHTSRYMAILGMLERFWDVLGYCTDGKETKTSVSRLLALLSHAWEEK